MNAVSVGGWLGFLAVALGAFGAHALRARLSAAQQGIYETAVLYHFIHSLALVAVGCVAWLRPSAAPLCRSAGLCFGFGVLLFSGSLYLLAISGTRWLGAITPIGGLLFLAGWACLALAARG